MKNRILFWPFLFFPFLCACTDTQKKTEKSIDTITEERTVLIPTESTIKESEMLLRTLIQTRKAVIQKVQLLKPDQANELYESFKKDNDSTIIKIETLEEATLEKYVTFYDEKVGKIVLPDSVKALEKLLTEAHLEFWEVGEGYTKIRTQPRFYLDIFQTYLTEDYWAFVEINAKEDEKLYAADGGLAISFEEVGERVINWEHFIQKYPQSKLIDRAKEIYKNYQMNYLTGMDNSPVMDYSTAKINPENVAEFKRFL